MNADDDRSKRRDPSGKPDETRASGGNAGAAHETLKSGSSLPVTGSIESATTLASEGGAAGTRARGVERPGQMIGRYKLLQELGEGGFGVVYVAEQREPVQRHVALKIIKLGMDTKQVIARFEAERQALALMDHPHIAKVFDAGATDTGRPYFVMELVKGSPITEYCDKQSMSFHGRLKLFMQVCGAVQHAHQKGIIHRDIKPSNVLVTLVDDKPAPKVIDFGIAKATQARLTEQTMFTEIGQFIGTPAYMSPEQADPLGVDIDTRSDIYSLGVLLYELLTGATPFDSRSLRSAGLDEIKRIIREDEPPRPSTRLSSLGAELDTVARQRSIDPKKLGTLLRGDLDCIILKALDKDRARRYDSANGLALDIERYLAGEAVVAAPPSASYRLQKFVRRNRGAVAAGGAFAVVLMLATGVSVWFGLREARQRAEAVRLHEIAKSNAAAELKARTRAEAIAAFVTSALKSSDPMQRGKKDTTIADAMANATAEIASGAFRDDPETEAALKDTIGHILKNHGRYEDAEPLLQQALETRERVFKGDHPDVALSLNNLASLCVAQGRHDKAELLLTRSLEMFERTRGPEHDDVAAALNGLGALHYLRGRLDKAEPLFKRALAIREKILGPTHRALALTLNDLALLYSAQRKYTEAEPLMKRALAMNEQSLGPDHPDVAACLNSLATMYDEQGQYAQAEPLYIRALAICEQALGPNHPLVGTGLHNLAELYRVVGKFAEAEPLYLRALAVRENVLGPEHADVAVVLNNLALTYKLQGRYTEAEPLYARTLAIDEKLLGPNDPEVASDLHNIAALYEAQEQFEKAETTYARCLAIREKTLGPEHKDVGSTLNNLAMLHLTLGKYAEGEALSMRAAAIYAKALGPDHTNYALVLANLARIRQGMGKPAEARRGFDEALAVLRKRSPDGSPQFARTLWRSGSARLDANEVDEARAELAEAVSMAEKLLPPGHRQLDEYRAALAKCEAAAARE